MNKKISNQTKAHSKYLRVTQYMFVHINVLVVVLAVVVNSWYHTKCSFGN